MAVNETCSDKLGDNARAAGKSVHAAYIVTFALFDQLSVADTDAFGCLIL